MGLKFSAALVVVAVLAGCAGRGPMGFGNAARPEDPTRTCNHGNAGDARFAPLRARTGTGMGGPTLAMRASKDTPTEEERRALNIWTVAYQSCVDMGRSFRAAYLTPAQAAWIEAHHSRTVGLVAKLYAGDITWGAYLDQRDALERDTDMGLASANEAAAQAQAAQANAEAARGLAIMRAIQASSPPPVVYQPVPVPPMPRTINCTTMPMGAGWTNTQCR
ncbi:hypothetical protein [Pseudorhodoferax sp. Leaf274]|uniref:hypothetical protein n=1 Tax=Pseudorhodoferax sp. Leaf274 TaxID=1736318 RepID=UPI0012E30C25|nr:hypothetical protein [Pseudorhodoferax sp. Leaf274]